MINMRKQSYLTTIMLVQFLEDDYWPDINPELLAMARGNNIEPLLKEVVNRIERGGVNVKEAYGIIHNQDTRIEWDGDNKATTETIKPPHVHILLKFEKGALLEAIALMIGISSQYLEKAKSGRYGYDNLLAYLVHAKDENKFQYSPDNVITYRGQKYMDIYHQKIKTWLQGRATKKIFETNKSVDYIIDEILKGNITKQKIMLTDEYFKVYGLNRKRINDALDSIGEARGYRSIEAIENGEFRKTIIYIYGKSGTGKTSFCKSLIKLIKKQATLNQTNWESLLTASSNAFDEFRGEEILMLDDVRGNSFSASDWLKLLDPYTISPVSARYKNKMGSARVIVMTSTLTPKKFFKAAKDNKDEDFGQFIRRLDYSININNDYKLSVPKEHPQLTLSLSNNADIDDSPRISSYILKEENSLNKEETLEILVDRIIQNNNWNTDGREIIKIGGTAN